MVIWTKIATFLVKNLVSVISLAPNEFDRDQFNSIQIVFSLNTSNNKQFNNYSTVRVGKSWAYVWSVHNTLVTNKRKKFELFILLEEHIRYYRQLVNEHPWMFKVKEQGLMKEDENYI